MCSQLLVGFHIRIISVLGNAELKLIVMCKLYRKFSCISILKNCKPKLYCRLDRCYANCGSRTCAGKQAVDCRYAVSKKISMLSIIYIDQSMFSHSGQTTFCSKRNFIPY